MTCNRTKSTTLTSASPGYKFIDPPSCAWYVANLHIREEERENLATFMSALMHALKEELGIGVGHRPVPDDGTKIEYYTEDGTTILRLPVYNMPTNFIPHISLYRINWFGALSEKRASSNGNDLANEIYKTIGRIPNGGLPLTYTVTTENMRLTKKAASGYVPVTAKDTTTGTKRSSSAQPNGPWTCSACGWQNKAGNHICGGPRWAEQANGRPKPCGRHGPE